MRTPAERAEFAGRAAAHMRANPTKCEALLWEALKPLGFGRQVPIAGRTKNGGLWTYVLDFGWPNMGNLAILAVEVDGGIHKRQKGRDRRRDTRLATARIRVIRFPNRRVERDLAGVLAEIEEAMRG